VVKLAQNKKHQTLSSLVQGTVAVSFTLNTNMEVKVNEVRRDARVPVDKTANTPYAILYLGDTRVATTANAEQSETDQSLTQWKDNKYQIRLTGTVMLAFADPKASCSKFILLRREHGGTYPTCSSRGSQAEEEKG
jgi:hypothetical protein